MSAFNQRIVYSDNGTLSDISAGLNDYIADTVELPAFVAAEDAIYIGTPLPFNQKYFDLGSVVNVNAAAVSVAVWDGSDWVNAVDIVDRTSNGGKSLNRSGYVSFRPDIDDSVWTKQSRSDDITGLSGTDMYSLYWARFTWNGDLTASTSMRYVGHRFSTDGELYAQYPGLNNQTLRNSFAGGSTTWDKQTFVAADEIIADLMERNIILTGDQILDATKLRSASIHKTAEIIYLGMGTGYAEHRKDAAISYGRAVNKKNLYIDLNQNADLDGRERTVSTVVLHR